MPSAYQLVRWAEQARVSAMRMGISTLTFSIIDEGYLVLHRKLT